MNEEPRLSYREIRDIKEAATKYGLLSWMDDDGGMVVCPADNPARRNFRKVDFPERTDQAFVYFMQCGPFVKIGFAIDIRRRHKDIQGNNPMAVTLVHYEKGGPAAEKAFHERFTDHRLNGEWFELRGKLFSYLHKVTGGNSGYR